MNGHLIFKGLFFILYLCCLMTPRLKSQTLAHRNYRLTIKKNTDTRVYQPDHTSGTSVYRGFNAPAPIAIDGNLSEWQQIPALYLTERKPATHSAKWRDTADLSAKTYLLWDQDYLYIACEVIDNEFKLKRNRYHNNQSGDWLQLIFYHTESEFLYQDDTCINKFGFMLTDAGPIAWRGCLSKHLQIEKQHLKIAITHQRRKKINIINYECAIPWQALAPLLPILRNTCKFSMIVNDDDGDSKKGSPIRKSPHLMGTLVLDSSRLPSRKPTYFFSINGNSFDDFGEVVVRTGIMQPQSNLPIRLLGQLSYGEKRFPIETIECNDRLTKHSAIFELNCFTELMEPGQYLLAIGIEDSSRDLLASREYPIFKYSSRELHQTLVRLEKILQQYSSITDDWMVPNNLPTLKYDLLKIRYRLNNIHDEKDISAVRTKLENTSKALEMLWGGNDLIAEARGELIKAYESGIDGSVQPYALFVPGNYQPDKLYPVVIHLENFDTANPYVSLEKYHFSEYAKQLNWLLVKPLAGRNFKNWEPAFRNVFIIIKELKKHYSIDENRIYLAGNGEPADAVWQLGKNYPQHFAAIAAIGGNPFADPGEEWEQAIFKYKRRPKQARANFKKLKWLPVSVYHNQSDSFVSGEILENAVDLLDKYDVDYNYHVFDHKGIPPDIQARIYDGFKAVERNRFPDELFLQCKRLKHSRIYWLQIDAVEKFYRYASIKAKVRSKNRIKVDIENVWQYTLFPDSNLVESDQNLRVYTDGDLSYNGPVPVNRRLTISFRRDSVKKKYRWLPGKLKYFDELHKTRELEGPIYDAYCSKFIIVYDDIHPNQAGRNWEKLAQRAAQQWEKTHFAAPRMLKLSELTLKKAKSASLIYFGLPAALPFLKYYPDWSPIKCDSNTVKIAAHKINHKQIAVEFIYPNPVNRQRYILINTGIDRLKPGDNTLDYIVINRSRPVDDPRRVLAAGYFNHKWDVSDALLWLYKKKEKSN